MGAPGPAGAQGPAGPAGPAGAGGPRLVDANGVDLGPYFYLPYSVATASSAPTSGYRDANGDFWVVRLETAEFVTVANSNGNTYFEQMNCVGAEYVPTSMLGSLSSAVMVHGTIGGVGAVRARRGPVAMRSTVSQRDVSGACTNVSNLLPLVLLSDAPLVTSPDAGPWALPLHIAY